MWLALLLIACAHRTATPMDEQGKNNRDPEVEKQITLLRPPSATGRTSASANARRRGWSRTPTAPTRRL